MQFIVASMSCNHCVKSITQAITALDAQAKVDIDLTHKKVQVQSSARPEQIITAITDAGFDDIKTA